MDSTSSIFAVYNPFINMSMEFLYSEQKNFFTSAKDVY